MPKERRINCPYYETRSRKARNRATITCELIENNLGFEMRNQLFFQNHEEKQNYYEIFCADMYETCPYYRALYHHKNEEETEE